MKIKQVIKEIKENVDRNRNPYEIYVAGEHMDSEDLELSRWGVFGDSYVGPAFTRVFHKGDVLYGSRRTYLRKVSVPDFDGITSNTTFILRTMNASVLMQEYIPFILMSEDFTKFSIKRSKGSTNPYVLFSDIGEYEFELPPIEEQRKLVKNLWAVEKERRCVKHAIVAARDYKDSYMNSVYEQKTSVEPECNYPKWKAVKMKEIFTYIRNGFVGTVTPYYTDSSGIGYLQGKDIHNEKIRTDDLMYVTEAFHVDHPNSVLKTNDILMVQSGHSGECAVVPEECDGFNCHALIIMTPGEECNPYYMEDCFNSNYGKKALSKLLKGTTIKHILAADVRELVLPVPSLDEQVAIVKIANMFNDQIDSLNKQLEVLTRMEKDIIEGGRIDV